LAPLAMKKVDQHPNSLLWRLALLGGLLALLIALAAAWSWSPLRAWLDVTRIVSALEQTGRAYGPLAAIGGFAVAISLAVPLTFLTLVAIVAFGPMNGFLYSMVGALIGAVVTFLAGKLLGHDAVRHLGGARVNHISQRLASRGLLSVIAIRMVPIAPFAIVNLIAGASHIRLRDLLLGTTIGMLPGTVGIMLFVDPLIEALKHPSPVTALIAAAMAGLIGLGIWALRRWLRQPGLDQQP
jgi:uncharacterized membrane protein YdjX (TVP38/TMEM64 family)